MIFFSLLFLQIWQATISLILLTVIFAVVARVRGGWLRQLFTISAYLDLLFLALTYVPVAMMSSGIYSSSYSVVEKWLIGGSWIGFALGFALWIALVRSRSLPVWVEAMLPVRKQHARRLVAGIALLGWTAPLHLVFVMVLRTEYVHYLTLMRGVSFTYLVTYLVILVGGLLYLMPFFDVLVRGWNTASTCDPGASVQ